MTVVMTDRPITNYWIKLEMSSVKRPLLMKKPKSPFNGPLSAHREFRVVRATRIPKTLECRGTGASHYKRRHHRRTPPLSATTSSSSHTCFHICNPSAIRVDLLLPQPDLSHGQREEALKHEPEEFYGGIDRRWSSNQPRSGVGHIDLLQGGSQ